MTRAVIAPLRVALVEQMARILGPHSEAAKALEVYNARDPSEFVGCFGVVETHYIIVVPMEA